MSSLSRARVAVLVALVAMSAQAQVQFEDKTADTNMAGFTETWGGSWGDINGDRWPDLINQGHREYPRVFRNTGDGSFQDIAYEVDPGNWMAFVFDDKHGVSFADFDNDGDEDMMWSVSATGDAQFLVNQGDGSFVDRALDAGVEEDEAARLSAWFDYNNDGHLDLLHAHTKNGYLFYRDPDDATFPDVDFDANPWEAGFWCQGKLNYAQLIDLDGDGSLEVLCMQEGVFPVAAFDYTTLPFTNVTNTLPVVSNVNDTAVADFDGDLLYDMVMTRGAMRPSGATLIGNDRIEFWVRKDDDAPIGKGIDFVTAGPITVTIDHKDMGLYESSKVFNLEPGGVEYIQVALEESPGSMSVEYVGGDTWEIRVFEVERSWQAYVQIDTTAPVTGLTEVDFDPPEAASETFHLKNGPGGLTPVYDTGLFTPVFCVSVVAGDFDNDMDQDLYMVCRRGPDNLENRYYDNQGDGTFVEVFSHGAEGPVGTGFQTGVGESAVLADYDVDGFLDIYVTNGLLYYPVNVGGPENLFRNLGNSNHWLEIDLQGTTSNRDGIGAKVYVEAGGVTQLREQNGGYHRWSQNHKRLHIGLGSNTEATVTIEWPSGHTDVFPAVAADALYVAVENGSMAPAVLGPPVYTSLQPGDECGEPPYDLDYGPAVLIWKDCGGTENWSLRAKGGRYEEAILHTAGQVVGDAVFSGVAPVGLGGGDTLDESLPGWLTFDVGAWYSNDKGFDFNVTGQTTSCLSLNVQDIPALIIGGSKKQVSGGFDLVTLASCDPPEPPPPLNLPECGEPTFDNATEHALFAWRDCDLPTNVIARWNFSLSAGGLPWASYSSVIASDVVITATGSSIEPNDTLDSIVGDTEVDFTLFVADNGVDSFQIDVPSGSITCLDTDTLAPGTPVLIGEFKQQVVGNIDLLDPTALQDCDGACHP